MDSKKEARFKRKQRIRKKVDGTAERPRLSVFRSAKHVYAQVVDDTTGRTLVAASSLDPAVRSMPKFESKVDMATHIGQVVGERALAEGIRKVVFDRNGFLYHGRIKAVSDGARKAGLDF